MGDFLVLFCLYETMRKGCGGRGIVVLGFGLGIFCLRFLLGCALGEDNLVFSFGLGWIGLELDISSWGIPDQGEKGGWEGRHFPGFTNFSFFFLSSFSYACFLFTISFFTSLFFECFPLGNVDFRLSQQRQKSFFFLMSSALGGEVGISGSPTGHRGAARDA